MRSGCIRFWARWLRSRSVYLGRRFGGRLIWVLDFGIGGHGFADFRPTRVELQVSRSGDLGCRFWYHLAWFADFCGRLTWVADLAFGWISSQIWGSIDMRHSLPGRLTWVTKSSFGWPGCRFWARLTCVADFEPPNIRAFGDLRWNFADRLQIMGSARLILIVDSRFLFADFGVGWLGLQNLESVHFDCRV